MLDPAAVWRVLDAVPDPEIPAISVVELGIVRDVACEDGVVRVTVTPTYGGCPATELINADIRAALVEAGATAGEVNLQLSPAWTTDWLGPAAREKLRACGIAPPASDGSRPLIFHPRIKCPRCGSAHTEQISAFGATACKAMHRCLDCREPFEYFKPI